MAPLFVLDYVVVHELVHLSHKNHSCFFWDSVKTPYPDYVKARSWILKNEEKLRI